MLIDKIKLYMKIDGTDEDSLIQSLIDAAEEYETNAGISKVETVALYVLAIRMLVTHWYEHREIIGKADKIAYGLEQINMQLRYCYPLV